ncbi:MAG: TrmH family RNA methyltransferase [Anaerolineae bacterium]
MQSLRGTPLKRFHRTFRRAHPIRHAITLVLQSVEYPVNVGSIFRIADATRIEELLLTGITPTPPHPTIGKVGRGKHVRVPWHYEEQPDAAIDKLREGGYRIFALEITEEATPYYEVQWPERVCLVVGHEDHGVTRATLSLCDEAVFVPMWGKGASLNVHVAVAVVAYHIRYRDVVGEERRF